MLTSRLIDRPIRPLFPSGWRFDTQIIALLMSADTENDADVLAITGASAALAISEIPFEKTVAGVRVGMVNNEYVINPTYSERKQSTLDLIVAGTRDGIVMVEAGAKEVTEAQVVGALEAAHAAIKQIVAAIDDLKALDRQEEAGSRRQDDRAGVLSRDRGQDAAAAHRGDAHQAEARELRAGRRRARRTCWRRFLRTRSRSVLTPSTSSTNFRKRR